MKKKNLLFDYVLTNAKSAPDEIFLEDEENSYTYAEALTVILNLILQLKKSGVKKNDYIAVQGCHELPVIFLMFAVIYLGAIFIPVNAHEDIHSYIDENFSYIHYQSIQKENDKWSFLSLDGTKTELTFIKENNPIDLPASECVWNEPSILLCTSGSTGKKKAVLLSHNAIMPSLLISRDLWEEQEGERYLHVLPFHHIFGWVVVFMATVCRQYIYLPKDTSYENVAHLLNKKRINLFYEVPTFYQALTKYITEKPKYLRFLLIAAGPVTDNRVNQLRDFYQVPFLPVYGMSECHLVSTLSYQEAKEAKNFGVGRIDYFEEVKLIDHEEVVSHGKEGEIYLKSNHMMEGYLSEDQKIDPHLTPEGYYKTADIGFMDEQGYLHLTGRTKEIIIQGGENLSCRKIEFGLYKLPYVEECVVCGLPDEYYGEIPAALIISSIKDEAKVKHDLKGILPKNEIPKKIKFVDHLPLTSSGKLSRQGVQEYFLSLKD